MKKTQQVGAKEASGAPKGIVSMLPRLAWRPKIPVVFVGVFAIALGAPVVVRHVGDWIDKQSLPGALPELRSDIAPNEIDVMSASVMPTGGLVDRQGDSRPLTVEEVFQDRSRNPRHAGLSLKLQGIRATDDCSSAAWGASVLSSIKSGECNQVIRGLYVDEARKVIGFVGILNMRDSAAAANTASVISQKPPGGFIYPLRGAGPLGQFQSGYSIALTDATAHYVFVAWVQRADGKRPPVGDGELSRALVALNSASSALGKRANEPQD